MGTTTPQSWIRTDEVRAWLDSMPVADAGPCDCCGHTEGPFVNFEGVDWNAYCHLCAVRIQAVDECERVLLSELFQSALEAIDGACDGIMSASIGQAARDAGERFLARAERS